jgi:glycosyltransferase involved in cell wall biosynthesis
MHKIIRIAVICNYQIKDNRIGSMDRFFLAFDKTCKTKGYAVDWFFPKSKKNEFYSEVNFYSDNDSSVECLFLNRLKNNNPEYNYVFTHFVELFTPFYKKLKQELNCKVFSVDHMSRPLGGFSFKKKLKRKLKYLMYGKYIDKIIAVSQYIKAENLKDFSNKLTKRIEVVHNGIDIDLYEIRNRSKQKEVPSIKFIIVSHLVYEKGIQDLIQALNQLDSQLLNKISVDIYGEGVYEKTLLNLVNKFDLEDVINFKGSIPNVYSKYANYNYMIQPTYMEAFSLSILESLCSNVPVITTTVGGNLEVVKHGINGYLFEPKNINQLKELLIKVCNENLILGDSDFCAEIRNQYALDIMVDKYLKLI